MTVLVLPATTATSLLPAGHMSMRGILTGSPMKGPGISRPLPAQSKRFTTLVERPKENILSFAEAVCELRPAIYGRVVEFAMGLRTVSDEVRLCPSEGVQYDELLRGVLPE
jgi:hypothetical protein